VNLARQFPDSVGSHLTEFQPSSPSLAIVAGVCPSNAFGGGSSKSATTTTDAKTAASEGSLAVGSGGKFVEGTDLSGTGTVTITATDSGAVAGALKAITDANTGALKTVGDVNTALTDFVNQENTAAVTRQGSLDDLLKQVLDKLTAQATGTATGFQSLLISPLFWLGMAGLAVVGVFVWRKR
jgi:hypothetical protein